MSHINVVTIRNPLDPRDCSRDLRAFTLGQTMADLFPTIALADDLVFTLNGGVVELEDFALTFPAANDYVTMCPNPRGGGGSGGDGKAILRIIAMIAITYFTAGAGAGVAGTLMGTDAIGFAAAYGALGVAAANVGLTVAGALLVNALLPPPKPTEKNATSPTYGVDNAKNTSAEGLPIPLVYGQFRYGGNIIDNYVVNDGATQYLYMLINCGEGPIASITDILINEQPPSSYKDLEIQTRLGDALQTPIDWFADTIVPNSLNLKLLDSSYRTYTTGTVVDKIRVDLAAPGGLVYSNNGSTEEVRVDVTIEYKLHTSGTWLSFPSTNEVSSYVERIIWATVPDMSVDFNGNPVPLGTTHTYVPTGLEYRVFDNFYATGSLIDGPTGPIIGYAVKDSIYTAPGVCILRGSSGTVIRRSLMSAVLAPGVYDVRIKRNSPDSTDPKLQDDVYVTDINEIILDDVAYRNVALLALKVRLSDQLNGIPTVTHLNGGKVVTVWDKTSSAWKASASSNPTWIAMDVLTNKRYAGGISASRLDMPAYKDWADTNDAAGLTFNGVFDVSSNLWDSLSDVFRAGHAQLVNVGTKYSVVIERPDTPVMIFSVANMLSGTFKESWLSMSERANEIEVTFRDRLDNYTERRLKVYDKVAFSSGAQPRNSSISLVGVVDAQRAWDEANLMLNLNRYVRRTVEFSAPIEAIACTVGNVILVQHDMPAWGVGGRVEAGCTTSVVQLDREATMVVGKVYQISVQFDALRRYTGTVASVTGTNITLTGFAGGTDVKRIKFLELGREAQVEGFFTGTGTHGVTVSGPNATGVAIGHHWELWDTNVLESHGVVNVPGTGTSVTLTAPMTMAPNQYDKFLFGEVTKVNKPFRIKSIGGSQEYRRDIVAIEYNESVYDLSGDVPDMNYSSLSADTAVVQQAVIDNVFEASRLVGSIYQSTVTVSYHSLQATYLTSDVFVSRNNGVSMFVGSDPISVSVPAVKDEVLVFQVVARDRSSRNAAISTSSTATYTVVGKTDPPSNVAAFTATVVQGGVKFTWTPVSDPDYLMTVLKIGATTIFAGNASTYTWPWPTLGTYTVTATNIDTSLNPSTTPASATVVVDSTVLLDWASITGPGKPEDTLNYDFTQGIDGWTGLVSGSSDTTASGGKLATMVVGGIAYSTRPIPVDTTRIYRMRVRARRDTGSGGTFYAGVVCFDSSGAIITNPAGGSHPYAAAVGVTLPVDGLWHVYEGILTGVEGIFPTVSPTYHKFWPGTVKASPLFFPNGSFVGNLLVDYATLEDVTDVENVGVVAASAAASATAANAILTNIASDSILSPNEKPAVLQDYTVITGEQAGIDARATAFGVTTEKTAYDGAITALTSYLTGLSGWNTIPGADVAIVGTTFRSKFADVYTTRQTLLNEIARLAGTVATWSGVAGVGKPQDYANRGAVGGYVNSDPLLQAPLEWTLSSVSGAAPVYSPNFAGGNGLGAAWDKNAGGTAYILSAPFAVSPFKTYIVESSLYNLGTSDIHYLLVAFYDAAGTILDGTTYPTGWPAAGAYHYYGLFGTNGGTGAHRYSIKFGDLATSKIPAGAVTARVGILGDYANAGQRWLWGGAQVREVVDGQTLAINAANISTYIANLAVGTAQIAALSVTSAKIANLAVDSAQIANLAVDTLKVAGDAISVHATAAASNYASSTVSASISVTMAYPGQVSVLAVYVPFGVFGSTSKADLTCPITGTASYTGTLATSYTIERGFPGVMSGMTGVDVLSAGTITVTANVTLTNVTPDPAGFYGGYIQLLLLRKYK